jgi:hypothetical protein
VPDSRENEDLELFLRQFEPRAPAPLPAGGARRAWWALAAAALVAGALWIGWPAASIRAPAPSIPKPAVAPAAETRSRPTMAEMSVVLRPAGCTKAMAQLERRVLADPRRRGGALRVMAAGEPGS